MNIPRGKLEITILVKNKLYNKYLSSSKNLVSNLDENFLGSNIQTKERIEISLSKLINSQYEATVNQGKK